MQPSDEFRQADDQRFQQPVRKTGQFIGWLSVNNTCPAQAKKAGAKPEKPYE